MANERVAKSEPKKIDLRNTHTFKIDMKAPSGEEFAGSFTIHRPTIGERINIGITEAQRLGGLSNIDLYTGGLAHMVATLEIIVDDSPIWWKPQELHDVEVITEVYNKYIEYLNTFSGKPGSESGSGAAA
jgi:hypothetical protein